MKKKTKKYFCVHGRYKYSCRDCLGSLICPHDRQKYYCLDCPGSGICPHKRRLYLCRDCEGAGICRHGKQRPFCRPGGGTMFCQHDKRKDYCKICSNILKITKTEPVNIEIVEHYLNILFFIYLPRASYLSHEGNQNIEYKFITRGKPKHLYFN